MFSVVWLIYVKFRLLYSAGKKLLCVACQNYNRLILAENIGEIPQPAPFHSFFSFITQQT